MKRLTSAQKARRRGRNRRGGKTRSERLREKIASHRRRLRENNLKDPKFGTKPITKHADNRGKDPNEMAIYGVYKDGSEWVLTGLAATDDYERMSPERGKRSEIRVRGRYVLLPRRGEISPEDGVEIDRFETKRDALSYVSADGSERIEAGRYLVRPKHDPRSRREEVDADGFQRFRRDAYKIFN